MSVEAVSVKYQTFVYNKVYLLFSHCDFIE